MSAKKLFLSLAVALAVTCGTSSAFADVVAGWHQNGNADTSHPTGFGFKPADFPQAADYGTGTHSIAVIDGSLDPNGNYLLVESFSGNTLNDINGAGAGGSFSFEGSANNGSSSIFAVPTNGYVDLNISWAQRGTSTGYNSRVFEYSVDGGDNWTDVGAYTGSAGALSATWTLVSIDLSAVSGLDNNPDAMFRLTYSGASSSSGNNRWDNFYVQGTLIPEPSTCALLFVGLFGCLSRRSKL